MNRDADEYIRQRTLVPKVDVLLEKQKRVDRWIRDAADKGYVESVPWVTRLAKQLGVPAKTVPRFDLDEIEKHWVPGWFWALVCGRAIGQAYHLVAPRHFREDPEDMRLVVIECLFTGTVVSGKREAYKYFLKVTENTTLATWSYSSPTSWE